jgi:uncharacterized protein (TIGR02147 family)
VSEAKSGGIFEYLDYREFLLHRYLAYKRKSPKFSYRYFAGKVGMDAGSFNGILKGKRKLDPALAGKVAQAFGLNVYEKEYFEALVLYCQAKNHSERTILLEKLLRLRGIQIKKLEGRQFEFYRKWQYAALRELLNCNPGHGEPSRLGKLLRPPITAQETRDALRLLLDLGLIETRDDGAYKVSENLITSGDGARAAAMNGFHQAMGGLAVQAIKDIEPGERDFSALTLNCSLDAFQDVKAILRQSRREILQRVEKDARSEIVLQINFQAFPLSHRLNPEAG